MSPYVRSLSPVFVLVLLLLLPFAGAGCGGGGGGSDYDPNAVGGTGAPVDTPAGPGQIPGGGGGTTPPPAPTPPGTTTSLPQVPLNMSPPIGLTWKIGYTENVDKATLQTVYSKVVAMNSTLWNVTEGQVYIWSVEITDNVAPGTKASTYANDVTTINTASLDILIWPSQSWDLGGTLGLTGWHALAGRVGVIMLLPSDADNQTWIHESGHMIWKLSWAPSPGLEDEYLDGFQDAACIMEDSYSPMRFCSTLNHTHQTSQPHSCWTQILQDYTKFAHSGTETAATSPWTPKVSYNDAP